MDNIEFELYTIKWLLLIQTHDTVFKSHYITIYGK